MAGPAAMNAVVLSLCACAATIAGGFFALRFSARLPLALGFTAGALLGVVSFELIPEAFAMSLRSGTDGRAAMVAAHAHSDSTTAFIAAGPAITPRPPPRIRPAPSGSP